MIAEKGKPGDKGFVADTLIIDDVAACLRHSRMYARGLRQALPFARNVDNG